MEDSWKCLASIITHTNTFDIGSLRFICNSLTRDTAVDETTFVAIVNLFLKTVSDHCRAHPDSQGESLALLTLDSLVYNLYAENRPIQNGLISFYNSMSMSQMSISASESSFLDRDIRRGVSFIQALSADTILFKKIKVILQRNHNKERNLHYTENFTGTLDYVLQKEKIHNQSYVENKRLLDVMMERAKTEVDIEGVNEIIFSNKLNRIMTLISDSPDSLLFALCRVYSVACAENKRKRFKNIQYQPEDMLITLYKSYVNSFESKLDLFQESRNPLYRLIKTNLICFYMPSFIRFHRIIKKINKDESENWLRLNQGLLETELNQFLDTLPSKLLQYLNIFYDLIQSHNWKQQDSNTKSFALPVKRLLLHSFLLEPKLVDEIIEESHLSNYEDACNFVVNLFFPSSLKKHHSPAPALVKLTNALSSRLDQQIMMRDVEDTNDSGTQFKVQEPILNHDYVILKEAIAKIEFTPKDSRAFPMTKILSIIESPIKFKRSAEQARSVEVKESENLSLATWMAVGGTTQYGKQRTKTQRAHKVAEVQTLPLEKVREVRQLYEQFASQMGRGFLDD